MDKPGDCFERLRSLPLRSWQAAPCQDEPASQAFVPILTKADELIVGNYFTAATSFFGLISANEPRSLIYNPARKAPPTINILHRRG